MGNTCLTCVNNNDADAVLLTEHNTPHQTRMEKLQKEIDAIIVRCENIEAEQKELSTTIDGQNNQMQGLLAKCDANETSIERLERDLAGVRAGVTMLTTMQLNVPEGFHEETTDVAWTVLREISSNSSSSVREIQPRRNHFATKSLTSRRF